MTASYYGLRETAEAVALYFKTVGVDAQIGGYDAPRLVGMIRNAHKDPSIEFTAVFPHYIAATPEPTEVLSLSFYSHAIYALYNNPAIDKLFERASVTVDDGKRGSSFATRSASCIRMCSSRRSGPTSRSIR